MKRFSILGLGAVFAVAGAAAQAQDFTAGKTPAQLFSSDCTACHKSPAGLAKSRDLRTLSSFLREHYTTKSDTAGALAAYVSGFSGSAPPPDQPRRAGATPAAAAAAGERSPGDRSPGDRPATAAERRAKRDADAAAAVEDARTAPRPAEDPLARRRRATNLSGDGEKPRAHPDGADAPRPPAGLSTPSGAASGEASTREAAPSPPRTAARRAGEGTARLNDYSRAGEGAATSRETADPLSRLRAYLTSGLGLESAAAEAAKTKSGKVHRRRESAAKAAPDTEGPADATAPPVTPAAEPASSTAAAPADGNPPVAPAAATGPARPAQ
jgi:hypothetical protein